MRIRLKTSLAGDRFSHNAGDIIEIDDESGKRFIESDIAEKIDDAPRRERAIANGREKSIQK